MKEDKFKEFKNNLIAFSNLDVEYIIAAAITKYGLVIHMLPPYRHHHIIQIMNINNNGKFHVAGDNQGFITSKGRYVDREDAMIIAKNCGQIDISHIREELYSEDLW